jgi:hypothetical protein
LEDFQKASASLSELTNVHPRKALDQEAVRPAACCASLFPTCLHVRNYEVASARYGGTFGRRGFGRVLTHEAYVLGGAVDDLKLKPHSSARLLGAVRQLCVKHAYVGASTRTHAYLVSSILGCRYLL